MSQKSRNKGTDRFLGRLLSSSSGDQLENSLRVAAPTFFATIFLVCLGLDWTVAATLSFIVTGVVFLICKGVGLSFKWNIMIPFLLFLVGASIKGVSFAASFWTRYYKQVLSHEQLRHRISTDVGNEGNSWGLGTAPEFQGSPREEWHKPKLTYENPDFPIFDSPTANDPQIIFALIKSQVQIRAVAVFLLSGTDLSEAIQLEQGMDFAVAGDRINIHPGGFRGVFTLELGVKFVDKWGIEHNETYHVGTHYMINAQELRELLVGSPDVQTIGAVREIEAGARLDGSRRPAALTLRGQVQARRPYSSYYECECHSVANNHRIAEVKFCSADGRCICLSSESVPLHEPLGFYDELTGEFRIRLGRSLFNKHRIRLSYDSAQVSRIEFLDSHLLIDLGVLPIRKWTALSTVGAENCVCDVFTIGFGSYGIGSYGPTEVLALGQPAPNKEIF